LLQKLLRKKRLKRKKKLLGLKLLLRSQLNKASLCCNCFLFVDFPFVTPSLSRGFTFLLWFDKSRREAFGSHHDKIEVNYSGENSKS
ncbi:MAG: hypothetical protein WC304_01160, partial [Candidatus Gracilibacteria bacterium]